MSLREGINITGTTSPSLADKLSVPPSRYGRRRRNASEYEVRLRAKQRVKLQYGLLEKRGRLIERDGRKYLVGYHPAVRFYREDLGEKVKEDFALLKRVLKELSL